MSSRYLYDLISHARAPPEKPEHRRNPAQRKAAARTRLPTGYIRAYPALPIVGIGGVALFAVLTGLRRSEDK